MHIDSQFSSTERSWTGTNLSISLRCSAKWFILSKAFDKSNKHSLLIHRQRNVPQLFWVRIQRDHNLNLFWNQTDWDWRPKIVNGLKGLRWNLVQLLVLRSWTVNVTLETFKTTFCKVVADAVTLHPILLTHWAAALS